MLQLPWTHLLKQEIPHWMESSCTVCERGYRCASQQTQHFHLSSNDGREFSNGVTALRMCSSFNFHRISTFGSIFKHAHYSLHRGIDLFSLTCNGHIHLLTFYTTANIDIHKYGFYNMHLYILKLYCPKRECNIYKCIL